MDRPIIAIISRILHRPPDKKVGMPMAMGGYVSYIRAVFENGGIPVLAPLIDSEDYINELYHKADGFIFTGGEDVQPENPQCGVVQDPAPLSYNWMAVRDRFYQNQEHDLAKRYDQYLLRDKVEIALAKKLLYSPKPTFGICRGIQILNVASGGTLHLDLQRDRPGSISHFNWNNKKDDFLNLSHKIKIENRSLLKSLLNVDEIEVNSLHRVGVKCVGDGLRPVGYCSEDGLVEAIELENCQSEFFLAVQWHPEILATYYPKTWSILFKSLVDAAHRYQSY